MRRRAVRHPALFALRSEPLRRDCPDASQVGVVAVHSSYGGGTTRHFGVFDLAAPYGTAEAIGFAPFGVPIVLAGQLRSADATLAFKLSNLSQALDIQSLDLTLWGTPWEVRHDSERGNCLNEVDPALFHGKLSQGDPEEPKSFQAGTCFVPAASSHIDSYLTLPTTCGGTMRFSVRARSWQEPGASEASTLLSQGGAPVTLANCLEVLTIAKLQSREAIAPPPPPASSSGSTSTTAAVFGTSKGTCARRSAPRAPSCPKD